jgi:hypothetical protein
MIASGGADNSILVWLLPRGQLLFRIEVEADPSWVSEVVVFIIWLI